MSSEVAKTNLLRLFYLEETRPLITPELYDDIEDSRFRTNIKLAVCFLFSEDSHRPKLLDILTELFRKLRGILIKRNEPVNLSNFVVSDLIHS